MKQLPRETSARVFTFYFSSSASPQNQSTSSSASAAVFPAFAGSSIASICGSGAFSWASKGSLEGWLGVNPLGESPIFHFTGEDPEESTLSRSVVMLRREAPHVPPQPEDFCGAGVGAGTGFGVGFAVT